jgi:hypothetical protein
MTLYILTEEHNDYDQHGEYFIAWFSSAPTIDQVMKLGLDTEEAFHVIGGGGRRETEQIWHNLRKVDEGTIYEPK